MNKSCDDNDNSWIQFYPKCNIKIPNCHNQELSSNNHPKIR